MVIRIPDYRALCPGFEWSGFQVKNHSELVQHIGKPVYLMLFRSLRTSDNGLVRAGPCIKMVFKGIQSLTVELTVRLLKPNLPLYKKYIISYLWV